MTTQITYNTKGTCSRQIIIDVQDDIITNIQFVGGCPGNTQGVAALAVGMKTDEVIKRLRGIKCGFKPTSCPDQLACALEEQLAQSK
jgi:uncharacterized protein (TIGR03905 family)